MNLRTIVPSPRSAVRTGRLGMRSNGGARAVGRHRRPPTITGRPGFYIAVASAGALVVNAVTLGGPPANASSEPHSVSVAQQLGLAGHSVPLAGTDVATLQHLAASRSQRQAEQAQAAQTQAAAEQAEQQRQAAAAAAAAQAKAEQEAAAKAQQAAAAQAAPPAVSAAPGSIQSWTASFMASQYGWGSDQMSCLVPLWNKESGWRVNAANPSSGAYGIPQALPGGKMASAGGDWQTNPETQVKWGLSYIQSTYGTPCGAWSHSQASGWY